MALAPALLLLTHRVSRWTGRECSAPRRAREACLSLIGLALAFFLMAIHSTFALLPMVVLLVVSYPLFVFWNWRVTGLVVLSLAVGGLLYSPFFWLFWQAVRVSQRSLPGFFPEVGFGVPELAGQVLVVLKRIAVGHNAYGIWMPVILVFLLLAGQSRHLRGERREVGNVLRFMISAAVLCFAIEMFGPPINFLKRGIPYANGYDVAKAYIFLPLFTLPVAGWIWDRMVFPRGSGGPLLNGWSVRLAVGTAGIVLGLQLVHSVYKLSRVSPDIYPQNIVLYLYGFGHLFLLAILLGSLYLGNVGALRRWGGSLIAVSVLFAASVAAYRPGVEAGNRGNGDEPIMSYARRYAIPEDLQRLEDLDHSGDRVVDLTRPYRRVLSTSDMSALPLAGFRTLSGYNTLYPAWYHRFITLGINGRDSAPGRWLQVEAGKTANLRALGLMGVRYVLAPVGSVIPGYRALRNRENNDVTFYASEREVGPGFFSANVDCFQTDREALAYINGSDLDRLRAGTVLVSSDRASAPWCSRAGANPMGAHAGHARLRFERGTDRVRVDVVTDTSGILTLADTYYPGWKVFDNGGEKPLLRTYTALRGVAVEPGVHRLEFVFSPEGFWLLYRVASLVLVFLIGGVLWLWFSMRSPLGQ